MRWKTKQAGSLAESRSSDSSGPNAWKCFPWETEQPNLVFLVQRCRGWPDVT